MDGVSTKKEAIPREVLFESGEDEMAAVELILCKKVISSDNIESCSCWSISEFRKRNKECFFLFLQKTK